MKADTLSPVCSITDLVISEFSLFLTLDWSAEIRFRIAFFSSIVNVLSFFIYYFYYWILRLFSSMYFTASLYFSSSSFSKKSCESFSTCYCYLSYAFEFLLVAIEVKDFDSILAVGLQLMILPKVLTSFEAVLTSFEAQEYILVTLIFGRSLSAGFTNFSSWTDKLEGSLTTGKGGVRTTAAWVTWFFVASGCLPVLLRDLFKEFLPLNRLLNNELLGDI